MRTKRVFMPYLILTVLVTFFVNEYISGQQEIIYTDFNGNEIRRTVLGTSIDEVLVTTGMQPRNLILDQSNNRIFWIEDDQKVFMMTIEGTDKQEVPLNASQDVGDLALDEENQILYFNEFFDGKINSYNLQTQELITIITNAPQASIAFSKLENTLYYGDGLTGKIFRYNLETEQSTEILGGFSLISDIAIDPTNRHIYLSEFFSRKVYRSNLDGTELEVLQEGLAANGPLYVMPENDNYYWSDNLAPGFIPTIYQSNMRSNETETAFEYDKNSIGGFIVLGESTSRVVGRKILKPKYFPNPASEKLIINFNKLINVKAIKIYSSSGYLVNNQNISATTQRLEVSLKNLINGKYILKVESEEVVEPVLFQVIR